MSFSRLATKYVGQAAEDYERVRVGRKWDSEHRAIEQLLAHVPEGSRVLDIPVGTGRLFPYFNARRFDVCGIDISADMLARARMAAEAAGGRIRLQQADIRAVPLPDRCFDLVTCLRFLNLIDGAELELALTELSRLTRDKLLIGIRYVTPYSDLEPTPSDLARLVARPVRLARSLFRDAIGKGCDVVAHDKRSLCDLIDKLGLEIVRARYVERRWDRTDYVLWLLQAREVPTR